MKLFLDCEFNGFGGDLISMALVSEDGEQSWYGALHPDYWTRGQSVEINDWVRANVIPVIRSDGAVTFYSARHHFNGALHNWLTSLSKEMTIYADWYTDLVHFFHSFQGPDHASSYSTGCKAVLLENVPELEPFMDEGGVRHNALSDARALRNWWADGAELERAAEWDALRVEPETAEADALDTPAAVEEIEEIE